LDGKVVGTYVVMDMTCTRGSQAAWKTGGIAGVAVLPEARQSGVGAAMMRWCLRNLRDDGYIFASLYGFRESYYRTFGYETCGLRLKVTCPNNRLPKHTSELPVRSLRNDQVSVIIPCYETFAKGRSGTNLRNSMHWGRVLDDAKSLYVAGDPVEAYAILEHDVDFWKEQPIVEFAWSTARGYESILTLFASIGINKTAVTWYEPSDSPFLARHTDQGVRFESEKPIMYRLLNPAVALEQLGANDEGEFSLSVSDPDLPENNSPLQVCFANGKTVVKPTVAADLRLDVRFATQGFLGQPSFDDLVRNGVVSDNAAIRRLLPPLPVYCMDHF
jgi:predicted acetyltransferase